MDRQISRLRNGLQVDGRAETVGAESVTVLFKDGNGNIVLASGTTVPTADTAGYAKGALFIKTDAADGTKGLYENQGTTALSDFNLVGSITSAEIADGSITLAKLAAGITPSHIAVFAGKETWAGGAATHAATVTGVVAGDIVVATIQTKPTQAAYLVGVVPTTDTVTFELSAANTSNDAVIAYTVLRAAA